MRFSITRHWIGIKCDFIRFSVMTRNGLSDQVSRQHVCEEEDPQDRSWARICREQSRALRWFKDSTASAGTKGEIIAETGIPRCKLHPDVKHFEESREPDLAATRKHQARSDCQWTREYGTR